MHSPFVVYPDEEEDEAWTEEKSKKSNSLKRGLDAGEGKCRKPNSSKASVEQEGDEVKMKKKVRRKSSTPSRSFAPRVLSDASLPASAVPHTKSGRTVKPVVAW